LRFMRTAYIKQDDSGMSTLGSQLVYYLAVS
jgi:hypothetical protein